MASKIDTQIAFKVNGGEVKDTFNGLKRAATVLRQELQTLTPGTQAFIDKSAQLKTVTKRFEEVKAEMYGTKKAASELNADTNTLRGTFGNLENKLTDVFSSILSGEVSFKSLGSTIKVFAAQSWAAIGSIPIIGWVAAIATGIGLAVREIYQFNNELLEANKLTAQVTKLQSDELDRMTVRSQSLEQLFNFDRKEVLEAARNLVQSFGITYEEAMDRIEDGVARGGSANDEFIKSIKEYPVFFAKAGYSAQEFINLINAGYDLGVYDDKLPDALKEFDLSMREQTKSTRDALVNAFGAPFADDILKRVSQGKTTVKDALVEITAESQKYNLSQKQQAQLTADIFRGAGEDAGGFANVVDIVTAAIINQGGALTEHQQAVKDQIDAYNELGESKVDALKSDAFYAFKRDVENIWIGIKKIWYDFITTLRFNITMMRAAFMTIGDGARAIPQIFSGVFNVVKANLNEMASAIMAAGRMMKQAFTLDFDGAAQSFEKMKSHMATALNNSKKAVSDLASSAGKAFASNYMNVVNSDAAKAAAQRIIEKRRDNAGKPTNNFDGSEANSAAAKKNADKAAKDAEAARRKAEAELKKYNEQILKDQEDANNAYLSAQDEFLKNKAELIQDEFERETAKEKARREIESRKVLTEIAELELKKIKTKSDAAKADYQKTIDTLHAIEIQNEEAHQLKLKTIQEKASAKKFEDFVKAEQRRIEESRRLDEDAINEISTMEEAELALSQMKYLKLTDQELKGIKTLEDAKRALREDADRKMLAASLVSLEQQKAQLEEALKGMTGEAAEKLKADLDALNAKITGLKGAINGGTEADAKKVQEEGDAAKGAVDVLGFSVLDWENCFKNLDTTEGKLRAVGMAFQALSNAGQMFADLTRSLAEKDMRKFEQIQNKKKADLLNQLNTGYITNEQYNKEIQRMEAETANKKAEMEYKQAKADKVAKMFSIIGSTAVGVAKALPNLVLAGIVGGMGLLQLGIVAAQPLPELPSFAEGGFTGSGFGSPDKSGFKPAGLLHEGEWTAPKWMVESPRTARVIDYLESVRQGKTTPMAEGGFSQSETSSATTAPAPLSENNSNSELMPVLYRLGNFLEYLITKGVYIEKNPKNGKEAKEMIEMWDELKNKNKH